MHNVRTKRDSKQLSEETDLEQLYFGEWRGAGAVVAGVLEEKLFNAEAQRSQRRRGGRLDLDEGECGAPTALGVFWDRFPALTGWAKVWRTYGAGTGEERV